MPRRNIPTKHTRFSTDAPCARKKAYVSKLAADKAIDEASLRDMSLILTTYQCPYCSKWHLSSTKSQ